MDATGPHAIRNRFVGITLSRTEDSRRRIRAPPRPVSLRSSPAATWSRNTTRLVPPVGVRCSSGSPSRSSQKYG